MSALMPSVDSRVERLLELKRNERHASRAFAEAFDRLRRHLGDDPAVMKHLALLRDLRGAEVVELGAGTGVMTERLAAEALTVSAFDRSPPMLEVARESLARRGVRNCAFTVAEHTRIPLPDACADVVFAAYALDSVVFDSAEDAWRIRLDGVVRKMQRLARPGGIIALVARGARQKRDYQGHLEHAHGFNAFVFEAAWRFASDEIAQEALSFFLSPAAWERHEPRMPADFPVSTGIWWKLA